MRRICFFLLISVLSTTFTHAQSNVGMLRLDTTFATGGVWQGNFDNATCEVRAFNTFHYRTPDANTFASIIVAGIVKTISNGPVQFGMCRLAPQGIPDESFGNHGKMFYGWDPLVYPNALIVPDSLTIVAAGVSQGFDVSGPMPTIFKFKANGNPDSSFATNGHAAIRYDNGSFGEFTAVDTIGSPLRYVAMGYCLQSPLNGFKGFSAMRFTESGTLDSTFGVNGQAAIPYPVQSATGYLRLNDKKIYFIGTDTATNPEIVLCLLLPNGTIDSSFGNAGIKQTGIHLLRGTKLYSTLQRPFYIFAGGIKASQSGSGFTLMKFRDDGSLDPQFGTAGLVDAPSTVAGMTIYGLSTANDGSDLVAGSINTSKEISAVAKFFPNGALDPKFGNNGLVTIDAGDGSTSNHLINFSALGRDENDHDRRKYLGIGTSLGSASGSDFLVARFDSLITSGVTDIRSNDILTVFPNPATDALALCATTGAIESFTIINTLGQSVLKFNSGEIPSKIDIHLLTNGTYYCSYKTQKGVSFSKFVVHR